LTFSEVKEVFVVVLFDCNIWLLFTSPEANKKTINKKRPPHERLKKIKKIYNKIFLRTTFADFSQSKIRRNAKLSKITDTPRLIPFGLISEGNPSNPTPYFYKKKFLQTKLEHNTKKDCYDVQHFVEYCLKLNIFPVLSTKLPQLDQVKQKLHKETIDEH